MFYKLKSVHTPFWILTTLVFIVLLLPRYGRHRDCKARWLTRRPQGQAVGRRPGPKQEADCSSRALRNLKASERRRGQSGRTDTWRVVLSENCSWTCLANRSAVTLPSLDLTTELVCCFSAGSYVPQGVLQPNDLLDPRL